MEKNNNVFSVGDKVHYNVGSDTHPGVVVKVKPSYVEVASLKLELTQEARDRHQYAYGEDEAGVTFVPYLSEPTTGEKFTKRKDGVFRRLGASNYSALHHGAHWYRDPSF